MIECNSDCQACPYNFPGSCLLKHIEQIGTSDLNTYDIAELLGKDEIMVRQLLGSAIRKLSSKVVDRIIHTDSIIPSFTLNTSRQICVVCESPIGGNPYEDGGYFYCSERCAVIKPPNLIDIEVKTGISSDKFTAIADAEGFNLIWREIEPVAVEEPLQKISEKFGTGPLKLVPTSYLAQINER